MQYTVRAEKQVDAGTIAPTATAGKRVRAYTIVNKGANDVVFTLPSGDTLDVWIDAVMGPFESLNTSGEDFMAFDGLTATCIAGDVIQVIWEEEV